MAIHWYPPQEVGGKLIQAGVEVIAADDQTAVTYHMRPAVLEPEEPDVCYACVGSGVADGGDMREDETCSRCGGTGHER